MIANDDLIMEKRDLVSRMIASVQEALRIVQESPEAAIDSLLKVKTTLDRDVHLAILKSSFELYDSAASQGKPLGYIPEEDIETAQNVLVEYEQIAEKLPLNDYYTNAFIR